MGTIVDVAGVAGNSFQVGLVDGATLDATGLTAARLFSLPDRDGTILVGGPGAMQKHKVQAASGTNATSVKASPGQVYGWYLANQSAGWRWIHWYDTAGTPTAGAGTVLWSLGLPPGAAANVSLDLGDEYPTGIAYTITTAYGDTDTGSCTAGDVVGTIYYN